MKTIYINTKENLNKRKIKKITKKIYKLSKKEDIVVALGNEVIGNEELKTVLYSYGIKILNGRWLFRFLLFEIIEYISKIEHKAIQIQNIAIMLKKQDDIVIGQVLEIAKQVKSLKIISQNIREFEYFEEEIYIEYGIAVQITNNKRKALSNTDIIINIDYDEEEIQEYNIDTNTIIVNIQKEANLKKFQGIIINDYKIEFNKENFETFIYENDYEDKIIYESYIYRKDTLSNIQKQLKFDDVRLIGLIQNNGKYYSIKSP